MNESEALRRDWDNNPRWRGIERPYTPDDVLRISGSIKIEHTLANQQAKILWSRLHEKDPLITFGDLLGIMAPQMAKAGLKAIHVSGWQAAAANNANRQMYPDQSIYSPITVPDLVREITNALIRSDEIQHEELSRGVFAGKKVDYLDMPCVADAEAGFGGKRSVFELMKAMIEAGAAGVHFEDQLGSEKKCGHLGGKVLVPTSQFVDVLKDARLAADRMGVPTIIIARTDSLSAKLLSNDIDERDKPFLTGKRSSEGHYYVRPGMDAVIARSLAYAPYADMLWFETGKPDLAEAKKFAEAIHRAYPGKLFVYNCSPSFRWSKHLNVAEIKKFNRELGAMGYKFQSIPLLGYHLICYYTFEFAKQFIQNGMSAYVELQEKEFAAEKDGFTAHKHQREVGTGYFDQVSQIITGGKSSTSAMKGSTEEEQFKK